MPSAACLPMLGIQCEYLSRVIVMEACPRRCWTSFGWTPRPSSTVAQVCLRSCQRISGRSSSLHFNNVLRGAISPEEAIETLQSKLQQIVEEGR